MATIYNGFRAGDRSVSQRRDQPNDLARYFNEITAGNLKGMEFRQNWSALASAGSLPAPVVVNVIENTANALAGLNNSSTQGSLVAFLRENKEAWERQGARACPDLHTSDLTRIMLAYDILGTRPSDAFRAAWERRAGGIQNDFSDEDRATCQEAYDILRLPKPGWL